MIVVDASVIIELLMRTASAARIEARLFRTDETLHAPHLIDAEVTQVLRRYHAMGEMGGERGMQAISMLGDMPVQRYAHGMLLPRAWQLRHNVSAYDAMYVALAELLDATLITCNARLTTSPMHHARMELI